MACGRPEDQAVLVIEPAVVSVHAGACLMKFVASLNATDLCSPCLGPIGGGAPLVPALVPDFAPDLVPDFVPDFASLEPLLAPRPPRPPFFVFFATPHS